MGKALTRNYVNTSNRPRKASTGSFGPYATKLACNWPKCIKTFGRKGDLKRHEQLHTGIKKHECATCGKMFSQNSGLKTHMNVHTGNKPYRCAYDGCEAEFGDPSSHARHRKETHQVDYHYKCPADGCVSAIKRRSAFAAHLKAKHDIVIISKELDSLKKISRPVTQRRKSIQHSLASMATPTLPLYYADALDGSFIPIHPDTQFLKTLEEHNELLPARETFRDLKPEPEYFFYPNHLHQRDLETYFTVPTLSPENLSNISAQSSTKTLVEDLTYDDNVNSKLFYNDLADHVQMINPVHFTRSFPPSRTTSPFKEDSYRLSPLPISVQEPLRMGAPTAFDRQRYVPTPMSGNSTSYQYDHKLLYELPQAKGRHHPSSQPHPNAAQQSHLQQTWGQWGYS